MPFLKTISGGSGSCKQVDDYLSFGHRSVEDHEKRMERYLAGDKSASRSMAFGHSPGLPDTPFGWHKSWMRRGRDLARISPRELD